MLTNYPPFCYRALLKGSQLWFQATKATFHVSRLTTTTWERELPSRLEKYSSQMLLTNQRTTTQQQGKSLFSMVAGGPQADNEATNHNSSLNRYLFNEIHNRRYLDSTPAKSQKPMDHSMPLAAVTVQGPWWTLLLTISPLTTSLPQPEQASKAHPYMTNQTGGAEIQT